jgi:hypothetical protein
MPAHSLDGLDDLDGERPGEAYTVQVGDHVIGFGEAAGPGWRDLMQALAWPPAFVETFGPADPGHVAVLDALSVWQMRAVIHGWRVHHGLCPDFGGNVRLVTMLAKPAYRAAAERDLWEVHHLDLNVEWQSRRWRRLLNLLDGLRRTSHVYESLTQDDELAEIWLEQERRAGTESSRKGHRRMTEFSVEAELLSYTVDRLGELIQAQATGKGARRRKVEPMPRPETAMQRVRDRRTRRKHDFVVARVFGRIDAKGRPTGKGPVPDGIDKFIPGR